MTRPSLRIFKSLSLCGAILLPASFAGAASTATYPGSENFVTNPFEWELNITVDELSGSVNNLVELFDDNGDDSSSLVGSVEVGPSTAPSLDAQRSPVDANPAIGAALINDALENRGFSSGLFSGDVGNRLRITSSTSLFFTLEYVGPSSSSDGNAVICLMPLQLAIFQGGSGVDPATASFAYSLEVDGDEIYGSSMRLTGVDSNSAQLTSLNGQIRTDGVFFDDPTNSAFGYNFPAITLELPMGISFDQFDGSIEANLLFSTTIEGSDNGWGGYAGQQSSLDPANIFIPISATVPEPQSILLLAGGFVLALRRRRLSPLVSSR